MTAGCLGELALADKKVSAGRLRRPPGRCGRSRRRGPRRCSTGSRGRRGREKRVRNQERSTSAICLTRPSSDSVDGADGPPGGLLAGQALALEQQGARGGSQRQPCSASRSPATSGSSGTGYVRRGPGHPAHACAAAAGPQVQRCLPLGPPRLRCGGGGRRRQWDVAVVGAGDRRAWPPRWPRRPPGRADRGAGAGRVPALQDLRGRPDRRARWRWPAGYIQIPARDTVHAVTATLNGRREFTRRYRRPAAGHGGSARNWMTRCARRPPGPGLRLTGALAGVRAVGEDDGQAWGAAG